MKHYLEETTHTHVVKATKINVLKKEGSTQVIKVEGKGIVTHGEHGVLVTSKPNVIKYVQKEVNPITKKIEDATD